MIASFHLADVGRHRALRLLLGKPIARRTPGLRYGAMTGAVPLSASRLPRPSLGRVGLIAVWDDDRALDDFEANDPLAATLAHGWSVRLEPTRVHGAWPTLEDLLAREQPMADDEPSAVLTLGRLRVSQTVRFLRASASAEALALRDPALLASTGLARPPALVATFSLWQTTSAMRAYARGQAGRDHRAATDQHARKPFHHESAFIRFRPYAAKGSWGGSDPLAGQPATRSLSAGGVSWAA